MRRFFIYINININVSVNVSVIIQAPGCINLYYHNLLKNNLYSNVHKRIQSVYTKFKTFNRGVI